MIKNSYVTIFLIWLSYLSLLSLSFFTSSQEAHQTEPVFSKVILTDEEQAWVKQNPIVTIGGSGDWPPFHFINAQGQYSGISHDYMLLIAKHTGLKYAFYPDVWEKSLEKVKAGEIDILSSIYYTDERAKYLDFSNQYFESLDYFFIHESLKAESLEDLDGKTLAIPTEYAQINIIKKHFPNINILEVERYGDAIDAVLERKADILYDNYGSLIYSLEQEGIKTIIPFKSTRNLGKNSLHIATNKTNTILMSILNKGLAAITDNERRIVLNRWLGNYSESNIFTNILSEEDKEWLIHHPRIYYGAETDWAPYDFVNFQGKHDGLSKSYLDAISRMLGVEFIPVVDKWYKLLEGTKQKNIDLLPALFYSEERTQHLSFSKPYQTIFDYFYVREDLDVENFNNWQEKTVAIPKGYAYKELVEKNFVGITIIEVEDLESAVNLVLEKEADFLIEPYTVMSLFLKNNGIDSIKPYKSFLPEHKRFLHMATYKGNEKLISIINKAIAAIPQETRNEFAQKWLVSVPALEKNQIVLTNSEQEWLSDNRVINFVGDPNWLPYEAKDENNNYIGIVADYLKVISEKLGVTFKYKPTNTWQESLQLANNKEVPMISAVVDSPMLENFQFTDSYLSSPLVIVMKDEHSFVENIQQIKNLKIALIKDYSYVPKVTETFPEIPFHYVSTVEKGITAVSTGEVDALIASLPQASFHISKLGSHNIRIVGSTQFTTNMAFGVSSDIPMLISILNKALRSISYSEQQQISQTWGKPQLITQTDYLLVIKVSAALILILLIVVYWNRKLKNEVNLRKEAQQQMSVILENIPEQVVLTAPNGQIVKANRKAKSDYNITDEKLTSLNISDFYADTHERKKVTSYLKTYGKVDQMIIKFKRYDESIHAMLVSIIPIYYNRKPRFLTIAVNVTERLEMERVLEEAKLSAEQANKAKSEFLANMSHEIRTPMNAIIGFTELLSEQIKDKKLASFVKTIKVAGNSLLMLINDILDLSKIEAGKLTLTKRATGLESLFEEIGNVFLMKVKAKNIDFILDLPDDIPNALMLDKSRLRQILFNLVGNAVKFTENGSIALKANVIPRTSHSVDLKISVTDTGIGIPVEEQSNIFESFRQREGQSERKYGGTGLGLTISRRLTELMNGEIFLESTLGEGSTFSIILEDVKTTDKRENIETRHDDNHTQSIDFLDASILIVDDIEDNRNLLIEVLSQFSAKTFTAVNGQEAVSLTKQLNIDFIFMDIRMPVMDGYEASQLIKQEFPDIPIIALTASVMRDDYERLRREYFDGYLRKPVLKQELLEELFKHLEYKIDVTTESSEPSNQLENKTQLSNQELKQELVDEFLPTCKVLQKKNQINEIITFSQKLSKWSTANNEAGLIHYAKELNQAAEHFDIGLIKQLLNQLSEQYKDAQ